MASRGRFRNIARRILHAVAPIIPERPRRPPKTKGKRPEPPKQPPPKQPPGGGGRGKPGYYERAWIERALQRPGRSYRRNYELFRSMPGINEDFVTEDERHEVWDAYLEYMVSGQHRRNDPSNPFWRISGIDPDNFDWDDFRTAMGYKARGRR